jgi:hypothetical protein
VYVCAEENDIVVVLRVTWPEELNIFWEACADFHVPLFQFHRDSHTYPKYLNCFAFCSF